VNSTPSPGVPSAGVMNMNLKLTLSITALAGALAATSSLAHAGHDPAREWSGQYDDYESGYENENDYAYDRDVIGREQIARRRGIVTSDRPRWCDGLSSRRRAAPPDPMIDFVYSDHRVVRSRPRARRALQDHTMLTIQRAAARSASSTSATSPAARLRGDARADPAHDEDDRTRPRDDRERRAGATGRPAEAATSAHPGPTDWRARAAAGTITRRRPPEPGRMALAIESRDHLERQRRSGRGRSARRRTARERAVPRRGSSLKSSRPRRSPDRRSASELIGRRKTTHARRHRTGMWSGGHDDDRHLRQQRPVGLRVRNVSPSITGIRSSRSPLAARRGRGADRARGGRCAP
jgi:hypothetical protein